MSIPSNSVLRRILADVLDGPRPPGLAASARAAACDEEIELWITRDAYRAPFATALHFWAHALRAFLDVRGRPDAFGPLAGHCLCDAVPAARLGPAFARLGRRFGDPFDAAGEACRAGYRMIEQDELVSWVAERGAPGARELVALFWVRPSWLATAAPLPLEPIEWVEPQ